MSETAGEPAAAPPPTPAFAAWEAFQLNSSGAEGADEQAAWEAAAQAAIAAAPACPCGGMPGRVKLLEKLFDTWWNRVGTLESDSPGYSLISYDDIQAMEDICLAIERMDGQP